MRPRTRPNCLYKVMRGLGEHLGLLVLQQRGAAAALESDLFSLLQEVRAMQSLTADYGMAPSSSSFSSSPNGGASLEPQKHPLPPQTPLRLALEKQRQGLLRGLEAVREVQLLLKSVTGSDPPTSSPTSNSSEESRARRARGGEGWGEAATDAATSAEVKVAVDALERSLSDMLGRVQRYPGPSAAATAAVRAGGGNDAGAAAVAPLLADGAVRVVVEVREALRACATDAARLSQRFGGVLPPAVLARVAEHLSDVEAGVGSALDGSPLMRSWLLSDGAAAAAAAAGDDGDADSMEVVDHSVCAGGGAGEEQRRQAAAALHASRIGQRLTDAVKAMLLSVQALCPRDTPVGKAAASAPAAARSDVVSSSAGKAERGVDDKEQQPADGDAEVEDKEENAWSTGTTLFEAHAAAFDQSRGLKLWRCAAAMASARQALADLSEDEAVGGAAAAGATASALVALCAEVLVLAEQVLFAGKAVLVGMVALNKVGG